MVQLNIEEHSKIVFSKRLRALRESQNLTQVELAEKLGVSRGSISFYENGDRIPDMLFLRRASCYFCVSIDYLAGVTDHKLPDYEAVGFVFELSDTSIDFLKENGDTLDSFLSHPQASEIINTARAFLSIPNAFSPYDDVTFFSQKLTTLLIGVLSELILDKFAAIDTLKDCEYSRWIKNNESFQLEKKPAINYLKTFVQQAEIEKENITRCLDYVKNLRSELEKNWRNDNG